MGNHKMKTAVSLKDASITSRNKKVAASSGENNDKFGVRGTITVYKLHPVL
jgi:hypothetical protein